MDELAKRAKAVGGWQALARELDAELKQKSAAAGGEKKRRGHPGKDRFDLDIIGKLPFPHFGGDMSKTEYIDKYRNELVEIFGQLSDDTYRNAIWKLRRDCPESTSVGKPMTGEQLEEALRKAGLM
jgi:hypothetical protein